MTSTTPADGYSQANAERFGWAGFAQGPLEPDRVALLERYVVGPRVLDAGCGSGAFTDLLARKGFDAVGVDKHEFCLTAAGSRGFHGTFVAGDLTERLPFPDGEFDTVFCFDVLEHVDDYVVLRELVRVAKRRVVFTVPQAHSELLHYRFLSPTYQDPTHLRYYTQKMLEDLASFIKPEQITFLQEQKMDIEGLTRSYLWPQSRIPGVGRIYNWSVNYLLKRVKPANMYMNWSVVIDLRQPAVLPS